MKNWLQSLELMLEGFDVSSSGKCLIAHAPSALAQRDIFKAIPDASWQTFFAEDAAACIAAGHDVSADFPSDQKFDLIVLRATQNRQEMRGLLADMAFKCEIGGHIVLAQSNDQGAKTLEKDIKAAFQSVEVATKHKCRGFDIDLSGGSDFKFLKQMQDEAKLKYIDSINLWSQPGLFSWNKVDKGSALLVQYLQQNLKDSDLSSIADFGCGIGYLSGELSGFLDVSDVSFTLIDHDVRAINAAKNNLENTAAAIEFLWRDLSQNMSLDEKVDCIVMNPPFHDGRVGDPKIGQSFIENAAQNLKRKGVLYMVANRHLPYERTLSKYFEDVEMLAEQDGFKVIKAQKLA
jgi:16S rRNA (guanine1207-N2)-methyltransferase